MKQKVLARRGETTIDCPEPGSDYLFYESRLQILPISEMRDTSKISELAEKGLICITKNGYGHLRILSEDAYRKMMDRMEFLESVYSASNVLSGAEGTTPEEAFDVARKRA